MNVFFLVLSKDESHINSKISELSDLGVPYLIVSGRKVNHSNVVFREPMGKYDAINFGSQFIPSKTNIVVLNDVDTKIRNFKDALNVSISNDVDLVFVRVSVEFGPQKFFYPLLDFIRRRLLVSASGEMMLIRRDLLDSILPLKCCKAEDSYILFKALELKRKVIFCESCYVETTRTKTAEKEASYKQKTVCGIYQALYHTKPPPSIKLFYFLLPFLSPLLLLSGKKGYYWAKGILLGLADYLRGDKSGSWSSTYLE